MCLTFGANLRFGAYKYPCLLQVKASVAMTGIDKNHCWPWCPLNSKCPINAVYAIIQHFQAGICENQSKPNLLIPRQHYTINTLLSDADHGPREKVQGVIVSKPLTDDTGSL